MVTIIIFYYRKIVLLERSFVISPFGCDHQTIALLLVVLPVSQVFFAGGDVIHNAVAALRTHLPLSDVNRSGGRVEVALSQDAVSVRKAVLEVTLVDLIVIVIEHTEAVLEVFLPLPFIYTYNNVR